ncbi:flagellum-specific ATP synthase [Rhodovulum adriaticum]|uniref:Flagellum-specific ATP synthase n=1 Tax=Rhodovulum adriaticum TaxID=35804 RepID=A0A4R2P167_RHOAD|nr:FliI/YscN family ATPase [Rhodovulum adriaticum]MBK1634761.1 flagellum-specific ATP synthase FliI [Rhodovulum adriaticum]TCP27664.1 flagellum-specific ATP synthase [Rhodovulum adriaticum]
MTHDPFTPLRARLAALRPVRPIGHVVAAGGGTLRVAGLSGYAGLGDLVEIRHGPGTRRIGEVLALAEGTVSVLPDGTPEGLSVGDRVALLGPGEIAPDASWLGRVVDPFGQPLDGRPLMPGTVPRPLRAAPPPAARRRGLGPRLATGLAAFDTLLPIVRGQRMGLFAGSGVGKSTLLGQLARGLEADVAVIALIGERGRELGEFVADVLGPAGMARAVVVAATSDQSPLVRRRAAWAAMAVAEHFRDAGQHVLFLADSVTRFAEAHRELALAAGEPAALRGYPPSTAQAIMALAERAGPGAGAAGDITAVFSVLVAGSDMEEPVADILRGVLDGHVVLDRRIAERGRFPAVDLLRSVSRSLPRAASGAENLLITRARQLLGAYDQAELMIQAGLYAEGSDSRIDDAIRAWPALDSFLGETAPGGVAGSFARLREVLDGGAADGVPDPDAKPALGGQAPAAMDGAGQGVQADPAIPWRGTASAPGQAGLSPGGAPAADLTAAAGGPPPVQAGSAV